MLYDEILKCYEGETELHANTSFEFGLMNETYWCLFRDHDLLEYAIKTTSFKKCPLNPHRGFFIAII